MTSIVGHGPTSFQGRPRYDGANINTFIGFKNFMTLTEEAVLNHLRERGYGPQELFTRYGLGVEIVDTSTRLLNTMHVDDRIDGTVDASVPKKGPGVATKVALFAARPDGPVQVLAGNVRVALIAERDGVAAEPVPDELKPYVISEVADLPGAPDPIDVPEGTDAATVLAGPGTNGFLWAWKIPYFFCHYYTRIQSSGYVRLLEDAVDRYLEHAGLSITELLAERDWIPVVSRARVQMHADAYMGETLLMTFEIDDVIRDTVFTATMKAYVQRGDQLIQTMTATIMHGWVYARGADAFQNIVVIEEPVKKALFGGVQ